MKMKTTSLATALLGVAVLLLSGVSTTLHAAHPKGSPAFFHDYNVAVAAGKKSGKPVIVVFSASWCPPCQQMKNNVYPSKKVQKFHDSFIWTYLDADKPKNSKILSAYGSKGIPHIVFLKSNGSKLGQFTGGVSAGQFVTILKQILRKAG